MPYEVTTIGALTPASSSPASSSPQVLLAGLPDMKELVTTPALIAFGAGAVVGVLVGALLFGGSRR